MRLLTRKILTGLIISTMTISTSNAAGYDRPTGEPFASRSEVIGAQGMAATSQPLATQIALDILKAGGSAVDAAIAANAALGLMEPTGCGIGGDLYAIVWDAETESLYGLNGSGRSPQSQGSGHSSYRHPQTPSAPRAQEGPALEPSSHTRAGTPGAGPHSSTSQASGSGSGQGSITQ